MNNFDKQSYLNINSGFYLDGQNDFIEVTPPFNLVTTTNWSISFWVKPIAVTNSTGDPEQELLIPILSLGWQGDNTAMWRFHFRITNLDTTPVYGYRFAVTSDPTLVIPYSVAVKQQYNLNAWQHIILTKENNNYYFYVGGVKSSVITVTVTDLPENLIIGQFGKSATTSNAELEIAHLCFFDKVLNHQERDELYNYNIIPETAYQNIQLYLPLQYNSFKASFNPDDTVAVSTTTAVNQVAHGFSVGDLIYLDGTYKIAEGLNPTRYSIPARLVTAVADADNFTFNTSGVVNIVAHGYGVAGEYLYCSPDGRLVNEETGHAVGYVVDADNFKLTDNLYPYAESSTCQFNVDKDFADKVESESLYRVYGKTLEETGVTYYSAQDSNKDFYTGLNYTPTKYRFPDGNFNLRNSVQFPSLSYLDVNQNWSMSWQMWGDFTNAVSGTLVKGLIYVGGTQGVVTSGSGIKINFRRNISRFIAFEFRGSSLVTFNVPGGVIEPASISELTDKKLHNWVIIHTSVSPTLSTIDLYVDGVYLYTHNVGTVSSGTRNYNIGDTANSDRRIWINTASTPNINSISNYTIESLRTYNTILTPEEITLLKNTQNQGNIASTQFEISFKEYKGLPILDSSETYLFEPSAGYGSGVATEKDSDYPVSWQGIKLQELNPLNDLSNLKYIELVNTNFPVENGLSSDEFTFVISGRFFIPEVFTNRKRTSVFGVFDLTGADYDSLNAFELSLKSALLSPTSDNLSLDLDWSDTASLTTLSSEDTGSKIAEYNTLAIRFKKETANTAELSLWGNGLKLESQIIYLDNSNTPNVTTQDYSLNKVGQTAFLGAGSKVDADDVDLIRYSNAVYNTFGYWKRALSNVEINHLHNNSLVANPKYLPAEDSYLHNFNENLEQYFVFNKENFYFDGVDVRVRNLATSGATYDATVVGLGSLDDVLNNNLIVR